MGGGSYHVNGGTDWGVNVAEWGAGLSGGPSERWDVRHPHLSAHYRT